LDLIFAGLIFILLFVASYSRRNTWITLGSTALTIVLVAGLTFLLKADSSDPVRDGLRGLATMLPEGWNRYTLELAEAMDKASAVLAKSRETPRPAQPIQAASIADWFKFDWVSNDSEAGVKDLEAETQTQSSLTPPVEGIAEPEPAERADLSVKWLLDRPLIAEDGTLRIAGENPSILPLQSVHAVLKPDSGSGSVGLAVEVGGNEGGTLVPPGARFDLVADLSPEETRALGGAILSFAYQRGERRKKSIMYLSAENLAAPEDQARAD
jgi:hypothetical protein